MDVGEMQKKLSQTATRDPNHKFGDLYSLLCHDTWLRVAQLHVNVPLAANQGSETAGVDRETMSRFLGDLDGNITRLQASLQAKTFEPMPVRRVYIPQHAPPSCSLLLDLDASLPGYGNLGFGIGFVHSEPKRGPTSFGWSTSSMIFPVGLPVGRAVGFPVPPRVNQKRSKVTREFGIA